VAEQEVDPVLAYRQEWLDELRTTPAPGDRRGRTLARRIELLVYIFKRRGLTFPQPPEVVTDNAAERVLRIWTPGGKRLDITLGRCCSVNEDVAQIQRIIEIADDPG